MDTIGKRLKNARKARGLSQTALADGIGVSRGVITNIERDIISEPQPIVINAICDLLEINSEWLINNTGAMEKSCTDQNKQLLSSFISKIKGFSNDELLFILDIINSYNSHLKNKRTY